MSDKKLRLNFYIIHVDHFQYRKATCERLRNLLEKCEKFDINFQYINEHDPQSITQEDIRQYINYDSIQKQELSVYNSFIRNLHINQLSNSLKHRKAIECICKDDKADFNIILEDDVVYNDNIVENLGNVLNNLPEDFDIVFLGLPSSKEADGENFQQLEFQIPRK